MTTKALPNNNRLQEGSDYTYMTVNPPPLPTPEYCLQCSRNTCPRKNLKCDKCQAQTLYCKPPKTPRPMYRCTSCTRVHGFLSHDQFGRNCYHCMYPALQHVKFQCYRCDKIGHICPVLKPFLQDFNSPVNIDMVYDMSVTCPCCATTKIGPPNITGPVPMTHMSPGEFQHKFWWCYTAPLAKVSVYRRDKSTTMALLPSKPTCVAFLPNSRGVNAQQGTIGKYMGTGMFVVAILHTYTFPEEQNPHFKNGLFWAIPLKGTVNESGFPTALILHPSHFWTYNHGAQDLPTTTCM